MAASFDHVAGINDVMYKAVLLTKLINECLLDGERPVGDLKRIEYEIQTYGLLSECEDDSIDAKSRKSWSRAVDLWEERLLKLVSSDAPDKCWIGIAFLGLTSELCSSKRFEASYAVWFKKLQPHVQARPASDLVKAALWFSLSDLLTRLGLSEISEGKRDGMSFAGQLVQHLLNFLRENKSGNAFEGAVQLTCTLLNFFPTSVHRHSEDFEDTLVTKILSEKDSDKLMTLAKCLAELPKSKGDDISWSLMMQKILISTNLHLKYAFQGLEEDSICDEAIRRLVPPGTVSPRPLGGHEVSKQAAESASKSLLLCCLKMLTSSYPVPFVVPVESLLSVIERVLMVDGSVAKSAYPFITVMDQVSKCSQLPILHEHCLDLLTELLTVMGRQHLQHSPKIVTLLDEYFNRCTLPKLRVKVYSNLRFLLNSMGSGLAVYISEIVVKNAFADLEPVVSSMEGRLSKPSNTVSKEVLLVPCNRKKRKHGAATESPDHQQRVGFEAKAHSEKSISLMIAALKALSALLLAGGVSKDDNSRSKVDDLLLRVANASCKGGWVKSAVITDSLSMRTSTWEDFQVASLEALRTSFLSSAHVRPSHLAEGLELFRRGELEVGTKIAKVCTIALGSLVVLLHPRARAVADFGSVHSANQKCNIMGSDEPDAYEDNLYHSWLENEDEVEIPTANSNKKEDIAKQPLQSTECLQPENFSNKFDDTRQSTDGAETSMAVDASSEKATETTDAIMIEQKLQEPASHEGPSLPSPPLVGVIGSFQMNNPSVSQVKNPTPALHTYKELASTAAELTSTTAFVTTTSTKRFELFKLDNADDMDSFPDIVDAEPDSDSDSD